MASRRVRLANTIPFADLLGLKKSGQQLRCPFAERHASGDRHKSARYYPESNIILCFAESKYWRPVSLLAEKSGKSEEEIAAKLLRRFGMNEASGTLLKNKRTKKKSSWNKLEDQYDEPAVRRLVGEFEEASREIGADLLAMAARDTSDLNEMIKEEKQCQQ